MLVILVAPSGLVAAVAMPTLGAVLIYAAIKSLRLGEIGVVCKTAQPGKIALVVTFGATLAPPGGGRRRRGGDLLPAPCGRPAGQGQTLWLLTLSTPARYCR
jgi:hypothetical protein